MKKKLIYSAIGFIAIFFALYLAGSFANASFNMSIWDIKIREGLTWVGLMMSGMLSIYFFNESELKK